MKREYKIELTVVVDDINVANLIDMARGCLPPEGVVTTDENGVDTLVPPEAFIQTIEDAVTELAQDNPAFEDGGIEVRSAVCNPVEGADTGVYLYRWPNGDFSIATGASVDDALAAFTEFADPDPTQLYTIDSFVANFRPTDSGEISLGQFNQSTNQAVWDICYPVLRDLLVSGDVLDENGQFKPGGEDRVRHAVEAERIRLAVAEPPADGAPAAASYSPTGAGKRFGSHPSPDQKPS